ncbi:hypothetical protein B9G53_21365 [Pseudanabaena sp. SR411]|nr:hypothetical protein B9G53_21365 [Pseudanabaena sp. SR411]
MICESVPQNRHTLTNLQKLIDGAKRHSNSHYETDFGVSSAEGARNTKIGFLRARQRRAFKKPILIMRIAGSVINHFFGMFFLGFCKFKPRIMNALKPSLKISRCFS